MPVRVDTVCRAGHRDITARWRSHDPFPLVAGEGLLRRRILPMLTPRQAAFVAEYQKDQNATQAAIRAGYSPNGAEVTGSKLLRVAKVAEALAKVGATALQRIEETEGNAVVTAERVLREYARIAFADMRRFATVKSGGVDLTDSAEWTDDEAAAVAELGETRSKDGGSVRFKLHSKTAALDSLAKYLGLLGADVHINETKILIVEGRLK